MKNAILPTLILLFSAILLLWSEIQAYYQPAESQSYRISAIDADSVDDLDTSTNSPESIEIDNTTEQLIKQLLRVHKSFETLVQDKQYISLSASQKNHAQKMLFKKTSQKQHLQAIKMGEELVEKNANDASLRFNLALTYRKHGDSQKAILHYQKLIEDFPDHQAGTINLGMLFKSEKMWSQAEQVLERAIKISNGKKKAKALAILGSVHLKQNHFEQALTAFQRSIQYRPDHATTWLLTAETMKNLQHPYRDVVTTYKRAANLAPSDHKILKDLGDYQLEQIEFVDAQKSYVRAIELSPHNLDAHRGLAWVHTELGVYEKAMKYWLWLEKNEKSKNRVKFAKLAQKVLEQIVDSNESGDYQPIEERYQLDKPGIDFENLNLVLLEARSNNWISHDFSCIVTGKALDSFSNRSLLKRAKCAINQKNTDNAEKLLAVLSRKRSNNSEILYLQGLSQLLSGNYEQAERHLVQANQLAPGLLKIAIARIKNLITAEKFGLANDLISAELNRKKNQPEITRLAGELAWLERSWAKTESIYRLLIEWEPENPEYRFRLAYTQLQNGNKQFAKSNLKELLTIDAEHIDGRLLLAQIHCNLGEISQCHLEAQRVLRLDKNNQLAKTLIN